MLSKVVAEIVNPIRTPPYTKWPLLTFGRTQAQTLHAAARRCRPGTGRRKQTIAPAGARPPNADGSGRVPHDSTIEVARAVLVARHLIIILAAAAVGSLAIISGPMPLQSSQLLDGIEEAILAALL